MPRNPVLKRFKDALGVTSASRPGEWVLRLFVRPPPAPLVLPGWLKSQEAQFRSVCIPWLAASIGVGPDARWSHWLGALFLTPPSAARRDGLSGALTHLPQASQFGEALLSLDHRLPSGRWANLLMAMLGVLLVLALAAAPMDLAGQGLFFIVLLLTAIGVRRAPQSIVSNFLVVLALMATFRYGLWRTLQTLSVEGWGNQVFSITLFMAEAFTWIATTFSFVQTLAPLHRSPRPLPEDTQSWPSVDIYIPSYNEPLDIVRITVHAAKNIDWPKDRLKVYLLDDGRRDSFREFAEAAGVGYITRSNNLHAKAGNLNHALSQTNGELIAIFDCDHVPVRSFLQMTVGWLHADPKVALVQTPHHFFSPDPFERNLSTFREVPNEGQLFNRLIQDGNDLWNAAFFCGSCAVIRRRPLEEVGGVAIETVTEDAHTALKLHRRGYRSAYINIPLAAGLATETLSAHIGQRIRWARGMAQIFRIDNPLFGRGLSLFQRICYTNASIHFFFGLPRIVFMTAPAGYLFFELHFIRAEPLILLMYAMPYITLANITNSRIQGRFRHSLWAEVYETVLAAYIALPTLLAMVSPKLGRFNVTPKGGMIPLSYLDWKISMPALVLLAINGMGLLVGLVRLFVWNSFEYEVVLFNLFWVSYNLTILGVVFSAGTELRQIRHTHRTPATLPAVLYLDNGRTFAVETRDFSSHGLGLDPRGVDLLPSGTLVSVGLYRGTHEFTFRARVAASSAERLSLKMEFLSVQDEAEYVACTFSRADAWSAWHPTLKSDGIRSSMQAILIHSLRGYRRLASHLWSSLQPASTEAS